MSTPTWTRRTATWCSTPATSTNPDLTVTVDYDTAKAILVEGNPQAGMQAFMQGKVRVEGDMAKLMALQAQPAATDPNAAEMAARLRDITE